MQEVMSFKGGFPKYNFIDGNGRDFRPPWPKRITDKSLTSQLYVTNSTNSYKDADKNKLRNIRGALTLHLHLIPELTTFGQGLISFNPSLTDGAGSSLFGIQYPKNVVDGMTMKLQYAFYKGDSPIIGDSPLAAPTVITKDIPLDAKDPVTGELVGAKELWRVPSYPDEVVVPQGQIALLSILFATGPDANDPEFDYTKLPGQIFVGVHVTQFDETTWE